MNSLFNPRNNKIQNGLMTILALTFWIYPEISLATNLPSDEGNQLVFEVKNLNPNTQSNSNLTIADIETADPLVNNLKIYLKKHNSPLEEFAGEMIKQPQWQRALAISWVESNFCKRHMDRNCSGIGVAPGHKLWRKYSTHLDWFKDMSALMEKPIYKQKYTTFKQMKGVYVQPGSQNWINGAQKKYDELIKLTEESEQQRANLAQKTLEKLALATFPDITENE